MCKCGSAQCCLVSKCSQLSPRSFSTQALEAYSEALRLDPDNEEVQARIANIKAEMTSSAAPATGKEHT